MWWRQQFARATSMFRVCMHMLIISRRYDDCYLYCLRACVRACVRECVSVCWAGLGWGGGRVDYLKTSYTIQYDVFVPLVNFNGWQWWRTSGVEMRPCQHWILKWNLFNFFPRNLLYISSYIVVVIICSLVSFIKHRVERRNWTLVDACNAHVTWELHILNEGKWFGELDASFSQHTAF